MSEKWLEIRLAIPDQAVDLVCQALMPLGCTGLTAAEKSLDTFVVPEPLSLANDPVLRAYFNYPDNIEELLGAVTRVLNSLADLYPELQEVRPEHRELADHDWASDWQQHFPPFRVGEHLVIHPSWVEWPAAKGEVVLTLDPGQAFGTGTHATTSLCLDAIADHFVSDSPPDRVLDVGTGSGILAMAAAALGAKTVLGNDIDSDACQVAIENIQKNRLDERVEISPRSLHHIPGRYDLVLANILATENVRLADELLRHLEQDGRLVLSGILIEQEQQVIDAFDHLPVTLLSTNHRDEWTCIVYQKS